MVVSMIVVLVMVLTLPLFANTYFFAAHSFVAFDVYQVDFFPLDDGHMNDHRALQ